MAIKFWVVQDTFLQAFRNGNFDKLTIGIGYKHREARKEFFEKFKGSIPFGNVIHPSVYMDDTA